MVASTMGDSECILMDKTLLHGLGLAGSTAGWCVCLFTGLDSWSCPYSTATGNVSGSSFVGQSTTQESLK